MPSMFGLLLDSVSETTHQPPKKMKLTVGAKYDISALTCTGWMDNSSLDGTAAPDAIEGYDWTSYFRGGVYLGQDKHGIEPLFEETDADSVE